MNWVVWCLSLESHHLCDGGRQCLPTVTSQCYHETLGHVWGHSLIDKLRDSEDWVEDYVPKACPEQDRKRLRIFLPSSPLPSLEQSVLPGVLPRHIGIRGHFLGSSPEWSRRGLV